MANSAAKATCMVCVSVSS